MPNRKANEMKFSLGKVLLTMDVFKRITEPEINNILHRHSNMDWGDMSPEEKALNDEAVVKNNSLHSVFYIRGIKVRVITEWDRSATTVILPSER